MMVFEKRHGQVAKQSIRSGFVTQQKTRTETF